MSPVVFKLATSLQTNRHAYSASRPRGWRAAELRPILHQSAALFEEIAATITCFDLRRDRVRERHFGYLIQVRSAFAGPIFEGRSEAVNRCVDTHAGEQFIH